MLKTIEILNELSQQIFYKNLWIVMYYSQACFHKNFQVYEW